MTCASSVTYFTEDIRIYDHILIGAYVPPCFTEPKFSGGGVEGGDLRRAKTTQTKKKQNKKTNCVPGDGGARFSCQRGERQAVAPLGLLLFSLPKPERLGEAEKVDLNDTHPRTHTRAHAQAFLEEPPELLCHMVQLFHVG